MLVTFAWDKILSPEGSHSVQRCKNIFRGKDINFIPSNQLDLQFAEHIMIFLKAEILHRNCKFHSYVIKSEDSQAITSPTVGLAAR